MDELNKIIRSVGGFGSMDKPINSKSSKSLTVTETNPPLPTKWLRLINSPTKITIKHHGIIITQKEVYPKSTIISNSPQ